MVMGRYSGCSCIYLAHALHVQRHVLQQPLTILRPILRAIDSKFIDPQKTKVNSLLHAYMRLLMQELH